MLKKRLWSHRYPDLFPWLSVLWRVFFIYMQTEEKGSRWMNFNSLIYWPVQQRSERYFLLLVHMFKPCTVMEHWFNGVKKICFFQLNNIWKECCLKNISFLSHKNKAHSTVRWSSSRNSCYYFRSHHIIISLAVLVCFFKFSSVLVG